MCFNRDMMIRTQSNQSSQNWTKEQKKTNMNKDMKSLQ